MGETGSGARRGTSWWVATLVAVVVGGAFGVLVHALPSDTFLALAVDDLVQLAAPLLATGLCAAAARRARDDRAAVRLWWWLGAACASWAAGQLVWCHYELVLRVEAPFPSVADVGFLGFPLLAAAGLVQWLARDGHVSASIRDLLDGGLIAGALLMVSWQTALGSVVADGDGLSPGFLLATAYPVGDLVTATAVLLLLARSGVAPRPFVVPLALGLLSLAVADSAYVYLEATGGYATGNAVSAGWVTGFLLIGAAAAAHGSGSVGAAGRLLPVDGVIALPYVATGLALVPLVLGAAGGRRPSAPEALLAGLLFALVLARQYLVLRDNVRLLGELRAREAALAHELMHDALTGLANRGMLLQRLDQLLALHARDGRGLVVVFCDLDDFKVVNDTYGHLAGDSVLRETADRLRATLRASDTVARLSGDEFAVLMEPPHEDPLHVAGRVIAALDRPVALDDSPVTVVTGLSIGIAVVPRGEPATVRARELLAAADSAMYSAKHGGKNRAVLVEVAAEPVGKPTA